LVAWSKHAHACVGLSRPHAVGADLRDSAVARRIEQTLLGQHGALAILAVLLRRRNFNLLALAARPIDDGDRLHARREGLGLGGRRRRAGISWAAARRGSEAGTVVTITS